MHTNASTQVTKETEPRSFVSLQNCRARQAWQPCCCQQLHAGKEYSRQVLSSSKQRADEFRSKQGNSPEIPSHIEALMIAVQHVHCATLHARLPVQLPQQ